MAMNNGNFGYSSASSLPSSFSTPYSATSMRSQRPRFAYSNVPSYPRPRSSATKPNPDIYSDSMRDSYGNSDTLNSMRNNYGSPDVHMNDSYASEPYTDNSLLSQNTSSYYSCNDSYYGAPKFPVSTGHDAYSNNPMPRNTLLEDNQSQMNTAPLLNISPQNQFIPPNKFQNNSFYGGTGGNEYQGGYPKFNKTDPPQAANSFYPKKFGQKPPIKKFGKDFKKTMASKVGCRCNLCGIDFTSTIPYEMHLRGAKHAKKLKTADGASGVQDVLNFDPGRLSGIPGKSNSISNSFRCDMCNVVANSSSQLQVHLDGTKHKNKLTQMTNPDAKPQGSQFNGKSNGSVVRSLPSDFGEPQPAKLTKLSCDICSISVNSDVQLQQHLVSKKHQYKVEGKPFPERKPKPKDADEQMDDGGVPPPAATGGETSKVVGVKTLSSSFVQGGTLA